MTGKLDPVKQEAFVEEYESLRKTKGRNDPIYFADACHPQHNSIPAYGWLRRGKEKMLKSKGFFRCRTKYKARLRSLLKEKFHRYEHK